MVTASEMPRMTRVRKKPVRLCMKAEKVVTRPKAMILLVG